MPDVDSNISATALKALAALDFLGEQRRPVTVLQVAEALGADRTSAYRMLQTLVQAGYVMREGDKAYRLSFKPLTLTRHLLAEDDRAQQILVTLRAISEATGETVHYSLLERDSVVLVYHAKGTQRVAVDFRIGDRSPLHCTSIGKVLLAYGDVRLVEATIASGLAKVAPKTITDGGALRRELARIRSQGYAFDDMEFAADMRCMAVPVFESGGTVPGGIAISGPASRFDTRHLEWLRDIVLPQATALSRNLGGI